MKKVLLALLAFMASTVVVDASAWFRGRCGARSCERTCAPRTCKQECANPVPVAVTRVEEAPCGPAPCCLTAVQVPANLVKHVEYSWECPTGCTVQAGEGSY